MSGQLVRKFRWFWDDADHKIENWLQQMAREGLHLSRIRCLRTVFEFKRGEPKDVTYRTDFLLTRPDPDYLLLFQDAGWEHVDDLLGWHYWRAPTGTGRPPEIFTDVPSQIRKYQRLLGLFAVAWTPLAIIVPLKGKDALLQSQLSLGLLVGTSAVTLYAVARLLLRIRTLKAQAPP
ncbi:DUF2812 domain-containing protein [Rugamonas aquatica]|uniref:DUF2812 domain-containing protein n=1 Tax=Rugamonas aquatica TaxID=2743357 RepID=A0A6A7N3W5_9BURK|nr:DUF2812 domain-containing protein [Rugamonas aquatica]MQA39794.1 DUF2812 domain-containing protein [Rugamonas aquatica]